MQKVVKKETKKQKEIKKWIKFQEELSKTHKTTVGVLKPN
jgi:hypothetical protein|tara:strand:+ start:753 stop:872 length:120 start_codon:yes stop_codon:yes gene_type:complete